MLLLRTSRGVDPGIPLLRSLGSNAHVWLPGASGVSVASLPSNNYLLSNGSTGYSGVDAVDGLTLDALNGGASTQTARFTAAVSEHFYTVKGANTLLAGDIEIICQAALTNWQTASHQAFASSDNLAGNYGFLFYIDASGYPAFRYSPDGNAVRVATCSTKFSTVFSAGANGYIRTTYNSVTGDTKFYTAPDGTTWTQLGATVTLTAGTVFNGTGGIAVGAQFSGTTTAIAGSIARVRVYRDLVGTIAVDFNPASYVLGSTSWVSAVGETWTFGGSTISTILPSGTHLTQPTTANKPLVRRGMLNLLVQSRDYSTTWTRPLAAATVATDVAVAPDGTTTADALVEITGATYGFAQALTNPGVATFAVLVKAGVRSKVFLQCDTGGAYFDLAAGTVGTITSFATAASIQHVGNGWYLCAVNFFNAALTAVQIYAANPTIGYTGVAGNQALYLSDSGIFKGTWTAAQILAEGGIPTTTATAVSNTAAGKYWWSFDGSNDSLLSGNLGITNACTIVMSLRVNNLSATQIIFAEDTNGVQVSIATDGSVSLTKVGGAALVTTAAGVVVAGVPLVLTARLSAGTADIRKLGVQSATSASALTFSATTGARIGTAFDGTSNPTGGALGWVVPLPTALSDADCLTVERLAGSNFPGMASF